jgi:hypothetical protein
MDHNVTALERAFQLAKAGDCVSVWHLKMRLKAEGYSLEQIVGRVLLQQLDGLIKAAVRKNDA